MSCRWMFLVSLMALFGAFPSPAHSASLSAEADTPYALRVVLRTTPHRLLTPTFRRQLAHDLRSGLQVALGPLARVEVVDLAEQSPEEWPPLYARVAAEGPGVLDTASEVSPIKTHFVLVDYADGRYELAARQHDGGTGLASPVTRTARTPDRQFVVRLAMLLIGQDFGVTGTVESNQGPEVTVQLKAGRLGPMEAWVKVGDVFALAQVSQGPEGLRGQRVPAAVLQATEVLPGGKLKGRLYHRYLNPLAGGLGHRVLKLTTEDGPVRLRLIDDRGAPLTNLQVRAAGPGVEPDPTRDQLTYRDGVYRSERSFAHLALVRVYTGGTQLTQPVPIEVLPGRVAEVPVKIAAGSEVAGQMELERRRLRSDLDESLLVQAERFKRLTELVKQTKNQEAKLLAEESSRLAESAAAAHQEAIARLLADAKRLLPADAAAKFAVPDLEGRVKALREHRGRLTELVKRLDTALADAAAKKPEQDRLRSEVEQLLTQAKLLADQAEYEQALKLYEEAAAKSKNAPSVVKVRDELAKAWAIKSPEHDKARKFVYGEWPGLKDAAAIKAKLPDASQAVAVCKQADDRLTLRKFLLASVVLTDRLSKQADGLKPTEDEADRATAMLILEVSKIIGELQDEAQKWINAGRE